MTAGAGRGRRAAASPRLVLALLAVMTAATAQSASGQIGALVSPGRLSRAHASLEGISKCLSCHAPGQGVTADRCLSCHKPVAARIAQRKGVHRDVTTDCVACHVEHAGEDADLRPFDQAGFDHRAETGFPLGGLHAPLASKCAACHRSRSFLDASPSCVTCHADVHKGSLGSQCAKCHSTAVRFKDSRAGFDHAGTAFPLSGAHARVECASCHKGATYKVAASGSCTTCHAGPHREAFTAPCASCHTTQSWRTSKVDHTRTAFPLRGRHAGVRCALCHVKPALAARPPSATCATCHADPHRGRFPQDCGSCHTESGFARGTFDHSTTRLPLTGGHSGLACAACHTPRTAQGAGRPARTGAPGANVRVSPVGQVTDFTGLSLACASCHADVHQAELGSNCETCHTTRAFEVTTFAHARARPFFDGQHAGLGCARCHQRAAPPVAAHGPAAAPVRRATLPAVGLPRTSDACASCHRDVHAGQLGATCERCHSVDAAKFAVTGFDHGRTRFPLAGRHVRVACASCHKVEARAYPAGTATARHFSGMGTACASCHTDPHDGQLPQGCDRCHTVERFEVQDYRHLRERALRSFFTGHHQRAACRDCHTPAAPRAGRTAPAGYGISTACTTCHTDVHRGALGTDCERCHKP